MIFGNIPGVVAHCFVVFLLAISLIIVFFSCLPIQRASNTVQIRTGSSSSRHHVIETRRNRTPSTTDRQEQREQLKNEVPTQSSPETIDLRSITRASLQLDDYGEYESTDGTLPTEWLCSEMMIIEMSSVCAQVYEDSHNFFFSLATPKD